MKLVDPDVCKHDDPKKIEEHIHDKWKCGILYSSKILTRCMQCLTELSERDNPNPPRD